jgi:hypothetical protein
VRGTGFTKRSASRTSAAAGASATGAAGAPIWIDHVVPRWGSDRVSDLVADCLGRGREKGEGGQEVFLFGDSVLAGLVQGAWDSPSGFRAESFSPSIRLWTCQRPASRATPQAVVRPAHHLHSPKLQSEDEGRRSPWRLAAASGTNSVVPVAARPRPGPQGTPGGAPSPLHGFTARLLRPHRLPQSGFR